MILLKNEADLLVAQLITLFRFLPMHRGFIEQVLPRPAMIVHPKDVEQGRFARATRPHHGDEVAFLNF